MRQKVSSFHEVRAGEAPSALLARESRGLIILLEELDDSAPLVEGLSRNEGFELVRAATVAALMQRLDGRHPEIDLVLLDVGLTDRSTSKLVHYLTSAWPDVSFVALADDRQSALLSIQAGARAALLKPVEVSALRNVVRAELPGRLGP